MVVTGDGNCLPRAISLNLYGYENRHEEVRVRIIQELVENINIYLDPQFLRCGQSITDNEAKLLPLAFALYSDVYSGTNVKVTYKKEILAITKPGSYMGLWQIFAASSVLGCPIFSIYPQLGNPIVRSHIHRLIQPRVPRSDSEIPVYIMWTSTRTDMRKEYWTPNHFTTLLPLAEDSSLQLFSDSSFDSSLEVDISTLLNVLSSDAESSLTEEKDSKEGKQSESLGFIVQSNTGKQIVSKEIVILDCSGQRPIDEHSAANNIDEPQNVGHKEGQFSTCTHDMTSNSDAPGSGSISFQAFPAAPEVIDEHSMTNCADVPQNRAHTEGMHDMTSSSDAPGSGSVSFQASPAAREVIDEHSTTNNIDISQNGADEEGKFITHDMTSNYDSPGTGSISSQASPAAPEVISGDMDQALNSVVEKCRLPGGMSQLPGPIRDGQFVLVKNGCELIPAVVSFSVTFWSEIFLHQTSTLGLWNFIFLPWGSNIFCIRFHHGHNQVY